MALPLGRSHLNRYYSSYKKNAKAKGLEFLLTLDQFRDIVVQRCHYCGAIPRVQKTWHSLKVKIPMNGVDRVDNKLGYSAENCVPCCSPCNYFKRGMPIEDFILRIQGIYEWINGQ
jgi:hypothetical protein